MGIKVESNVRFAETLKKKKAAAEKALEQAVSDHVKTVVQNATSGKNFEGKSFKAYSPGYRKRREKAGYSTKPNLTITGNMLSAIQYRAEIMGNKFRAILFVANTSSKAPKKMGGGVATAPEKIDRNRANGRDPFGLSQRQFKKIAKYVIEQIGKIKNV